MASKFHKALARGAWSPSASLITSLGSSGSNMYFTRTGTRLNVNDHHAIHVLGVSQSSDDIVSHLAPRSHVDHNCLGFGCAPRTWKRMKQHTTFARHRGSRICSRITSRSAPRLRDCNHARYHHLRTAHRSGIGGATIQPASHPGAGPAGVSNLRAALQLAPVMTCQPGAAFFV